MSAPMLSHTSSPNSSTQLQTNTPVATTEVAALKCLKNEKLDSYKLD